MPDPRIAPVPEDRPALVVLPGELAGRDDSPKTMAAIPGSRMFEIRDALAVFERDQPGRDQFDASQGDGGASLPGVPEELLDAAHALQKEHGTGYDQPFGTNLFRKVIAEQYWGLDAASGWGPENVVACQGGRDALLKAYEAMQFLGMKRRGDFVVVSRVPWISYNWGPYAVGANVLLAPGREADGWALTPEGIAETVHEAERHGRGVAGLVVTSPDNPTGRTVSARRAARAGPRCVRRRDPVRALRLDLPPRRRRAAARPQRLPRAADAGRARPLHDPRRDHQVARRQQRAQRAPGRLEGGREVRLRAAPRTA